MGLSEVLADLIRIEHIKEIRRAQSSRALAAPEEAGKLFEQYPGRVAPEVGPSEPMGPGLAMSLEGMDSATQIPGGYVNPPVARSAGPTQVPLDVERAFGESFGTPLRGMTGTPSTTEREISSFRAKVPATLDAERQGIPLELEKTEKTSEITLRRQKELADYLKKIHPERDPNVRTKATRENAMFDDLYNIQNWHAEQMHMVRQDPRAQKNPETMKQFSKEINQTMIDKVRALENQYPDLILKNEKAQRSISKLKALGILSPVYPEKKK